MEKVSLYRFSFFLALILPTLPTSHAIIPFQNRTWPSRVYDGQIGFPSYGAMGQLIKSIDGKYLSALEPAYANATATMNLRVMRTPALIVFPANTQDIQKVVAFATSYNLHLCIRSSGHSYIGRSTHGGSIVLDLSMMRDISVTLASNRSRAGEVKVQSGASWIEVYQKVDTVSGPDASGKKKVGRVVVGGSAHTVAMGGYTQGGGHAPICRRFGLAVDNLLEATLVTADGQILTLTADKTVIHNMDGTKRMTSDTSLFWAIRGGGGGTWGVIVTFTFKLHYAPERFRNLVLYYPLFTPTGSRVYEDSVQTAMSEMVKMSEDWGGYVLTIPGPVPKTEFNGLVMLFLNHYGSDSSPSNQEGEELINKTKPIYKTDTKYKTFLEYEVNAKDPAYYNTYIANTFVQPSTLKDHRQRDAFVDFLYRQVKDSVGCTLAMIGGKVMKAHPRPETPVNPAFRNGMFSASCGVGWAYNPVEDEVHIKKALLMAEELYSHGIGSYFNEPAEDMADWKERFWADEDTYKRLLKIKKRFDPTNYFWCHNCVGSDLGKDYGPPAHRQLPGQSVKGNITRGQANGQRQSVFQASE